MSGGAPVPFERLRGHALGVLDAAAAAGVDVRLTGGLAVRERARDAGGLDLADRPYHDIDLVARRRDIRALDALFRDLAFTPDRAVNTQFGTVRRVYHHPDGFHADVFLDRLEFCHTIELADRLALVPVTLAPADLLLGKLQIVERNRKDLVDACLLLLNHPLRSGDPSGIELERVTALTADDWGLHTTATDFLDVLDAFLPQAALVDAARLVVRERIDALRAATSAAPKSLRWRARERIGRRVRWYRVVEEVL